MYFLCVRMCVLNCWSHVVKTTTRQLRSKNNLKNTRGTHHIVAYCFASLLAPFPIPLSPSPAPSLPCSLTLWLCQSASVKLSPETNAWQPCLAMSASFSLPPVSSPLLSSPLLSPFSFFTSPQFTAPSTVYEAINASWRFPLLFFLEKQLQFHIEVHYVRFTCFDFDIDCDFDWS